MMRNEEPAGGSDARRVRVLTLVAEPVRDGFPGKASRGLVEALRDDVEVTGVYRPEPGGLERLRIVTRAFHPRPRTWRKRIDLSPATFRAMSRLATAEVERRAGSYDVVLQFQTLFGADVPDGRYAVATDNIYSLTARFYPAWAPLPAPAAKEFEDLERGVFQRAAVVLARSDFVGRAIVDDYGVDPARVVRIGGGANSYLTDLPADASRYARQRALFVGYDFTRKGGEVLLSAWKAVRSRLPAAELWIAGPAPRRAEPGVRWLGRIDDRGALRRLYEEATIFVLPSLFEPFGFVFLEAQGHGLACVGTDRCAMPEIIADGETGLLVPASDEPALADAIVLLLAAPDRAERLGRRAHARVIESFLWSQVADRAAVALQTLVRVRPE